MDYIYAKFQVNWSQLDWSRYVRLGLDLLRSRSIYKLGLGLWVDHCVMRDDGYRGRNTAINPGEVGTARVAVWAADSLRAPPITGSAGCRDSPLSSLPRIGTHTPGNKAALGSAPLTEWVK